MVPMINPRQPNHRVRQAQPMLIIALLLGLLCSAWMPHIGIAGAADTWYVAPTGDDQATCQTPDTACRTINAAVGKARNGDNVVIAAGNYQEQLTLSKDLHIKGAGAVMTLLDGSGGQVVTIQSGTRVILSGLTIRSGSGDAGGGVSNQGILFLDTSIVTGNTASAGGGLYNSGAATLTNAIVSGNTSRGSWSNGGGGLYNSGTLTLTNVLVSSNSAKFFFFCTPGFGGGLYNSGRAALTNVTLHDNFAEAAPREFGGGDCGGGGGGIYHGNPSSQTRLPHGLLHPQDANLPATVSLTLTNVTLSDNEAANGSGLYSIGTAALKNVTLSGSSTTPLSGIESRSFSNSNATILVANSILATNARNGNCVRGYRSLIISEGHNLSSDSSCASAFTAPGDRNGADPLLGPLQNNGGPTPTHALLWASPAVDGADASHCPATDQRGVGRPLDGNQDGTAICDIGAYEYEFQRAFLYLPLVTDASGTP